MELTLNSADYMLDRKDLDLQRFFEVITNSVRLLKANFVFTSLPQAIQKGQSGLFLPILLALWDGGHIERHV